MCPSAITGSFFWNGYKFAASTSLAQCYSGPLSLLTGEWVVSLTDRCAPVAQTLAPVFRGEAAE